MKSQVTPSVTAVVMIDLRTLGTLDLRVRDGPELLSVISQPKRTALLCYFALAEPRGFHRRDTLLALFWPEADAEHAHASLRQSVRFLRRSLGDDVIVSRGDDDLALGEGVLACDAVQFEEALAAGERERALALYRGELLPGFYVEGAPDFERWLEGERTRLRANALAAAWALAEARERLGDAAGAAEWARGALALAPDDAGVRRLMQTLERLGDREGALAAYNSWARRLRAEYEIEPSAEARALVEEIRARGAAPTGRAARVPGHPVAPAASEPADGPGDSSRILAVNPAVEPRALAVTAAPDLPVQRWRGRRWRIGLIALAALAVAAFAGVGVWTVIGYGPGSSALDPRRVAVLPFENRTGDPALEPLGAMAADWITEALASTGVVKVVDAWEAAAAARARTGTRDSSRAALAEAAAATGAGLVVVGTFYREGDSVRVVSKVVRARTGDVVAALGPVAAYAGAPVSAADLLSQRLLTALLPLIDERLAAPEPPPARPPTFEAYRLFLEGIDLYLDGSSADAADRFQAALDADSSFDRALVWLAQAALFAPYHTGEPVLVRFDSVTPALRRAYPRLAPFDRYHADFILAYRKGEYRAAYRAAQLRVQASPGSDEALRELAQSAARINRPAETARILETLRRSRGSASARAFSNDGSLRQAYHELGRYADELALAEQATAPERAACVEIPSLAALASIDRLRVAVRACAARPPRIAGRVERVSALPSLPYLLAGEELMAHGHPDLARAFFEGALSWLRSVGGESAPDTIPRLYYAEALTLAGSWTEAARVLPALPPDHEFYAEARYYRGLIAANRGERALAVSIEEELRRIPVRTWYNWFSDQGQLRIRRAAIALALADRARALSYLQELYAAGTNHRDVVHRDPALAALRNDPAFVAITRPEG